MHKAKERRRIAKDPFHQEILAALARHLDPQVFETCMADVLGKIFPGLVPVEGGADAGMDGALLKGGGEPGPLVCTTEEDVAANLERSLDAFLGRGLSGREAVLATSRTLTPRETRKLFGLAAKRGFTLRQVFERSAVAFLLYRESTWCQRLLGVTGSPSALSFVPLSRRPPLGVELQGRAEDLEWLQSTSGDRVVVGEPGSGKTYLFSWLIRNGWPALFLVSDDETAIAKAVRDQAPSIVIADDAHVEPARLVRLRRLRHEIHAEFDIVASTWQGGRTGVIEALGGFPESQVHKLDLLTRDQILQVFREVGVRTSDEVLANLVTQASNKPGLAVTIARLWLQGDWQRILDGTVLGQAVLGLKGLIGGEVGDVLAAFSLGGRQGMSLEAAGRGCGLSSREIWKLTSDLAAAGVLSEIGGQRIVVRPQVLRSALLRQVFFPDSAIRLDYRSLLPLVPSFDSAVEEIAMARAHGAAVAPDELHDLLIRSRARRAWSILAMVSEEEAAWVLASYRGNLLEVAAELLLQIPHSVIPRILERAANPTALSLRPGAPMSILSAWVRDLRVDPNELIQRRRILADAAKRFLADGGDCQTGINGICIALSPTVRHTGPDPGLGTTFTMRAALLSAESLRELESIWGGVESAIQEIGVGAWQHLSCLIQDWLQPEYAAPGARVSEAQRQTMRAFASRLLGDLASRARDSPGLQAGLERLASRSGLDLRVERDAVFDLLYPQGEARFATAKTQEAIEALAAEWRAGPPREVAQRLACYEREAEKTGHRWLSNMPGLCVALAGMVYKPEEWLDALLGQGLRAILIIPFLERVVTLRREGWAEQLEAGLDRAPLIWSAMSLVLQLPDPSPALLGRALERAVEEPMQVEFLCNQKRIPLATLRKLLALASWESSLAAAVGEWCSEPQGDVRAEILSAWRCALLRAKTEDYTDAQHLPGLGFWLNVILSSDADLAFDWLQSRLRDPDLPGPFMGDSAFSYAARALRREQREELLGQMEPALILHSLIPALIAGDTQLYKKLLTLRSLAEFHLCPLAGPEKAEWETFTVAAIEAGYDPEAIAGASFGMSAGSGLEYWGKWDAAFTKFAEHPRRELREVARHGRARAQAEIGMARKRQRAFELRGVGRDGWSLD